MNDTQSKIGRLLGPDEQRDAVHIAVAPVVAGERLWPGDHVGLAGGTAVKGNGIKRVGIVDPFFAGPVNPGERCWLFLYPNTITDMRHAWEHPAFSDSARPAAASISPSKADAEKWLRTFADEWGMNFDLMIEDAQFKCGIVALDRDIHSWSEIDDGGVAFWSNLEAFTGRKFDAQHRENTYFSCSC